MDLKVYVKDDITTTLTFRGQPILVGATVKQAIIVRNLGCDFSLLLNGQSIQDNTRIESNSFLHIRHLVRGGGLKKPKKKKKASSKQNPKTKKNKKPHPPSIEAPASDNNPPTADNNTSLASVSEFLELQYLNPWELKRLFWMAWSDTQNMWSLLPRDVIKMIIQFTLEPDSKHGNYPYPKNRKGFVENVKAGGGFENDEKEKKCFQLLDKLLLANTRSKHVDSRNEILEICNLLEENRHYRRNF